MRNFPRLYRLWRGFQSALFFYLSCSPWHGWKRNRAQRRQDQRDQKHEQDLESTQYRQPKPFGTNPYWNQELALGPGPPARHLTKKQKRFFELLRTSDSVTRSNTPVNNASQTDLKMASVDGGVNSTSTLPESERWKLHQRPDEPLWGSEQHISSSAPSLESASSGKQGAWTAASPPRSNPSYCMVRNPPINDLSPPIVSNPAQNEGSNMWMLQPPPRAEVMSGHQSANRSRSTTNSSVDSRKTGQASLSRQLSKRLMEEKMNRSGLLFPNHRFEYGDGDAYDGPRNRMSAIEASYDLGQDSGARKRFRPSSDDSQNSTTTVIRSPSPAQPDLEVQDGGIPAYQDLNEGTQRQDFALPNETPPSKLRSATVSHPGSSSARNTPRLPQLSTGLDDTGNVGRDRLKGIFPRISSPFSGSHQPPGDEASASAADELPSIEDSTFVRSKLAWRRSVDF